MILHIAQFTFKPEVTPTDVDALQAALYDMVAQLPFIKSYIAHPNLRVRPSDTDFVCVALLEAPEDLERYMEAPEHKKVYAEHLDWMVASRSAAQVPVETEGFR